MIKSLEKIIIAADYICSIVENRDEDALLCKAYLKKFLFQCIKACDVPEENQNKSFFNTLKDHINSTLEKHEEEKGTDNIFIVRGSHEERNLEYDIIDDDYIKINNINNAIHYSDMYQLLTDESIDEISKKTFDELVRDIIKQKERARMESKRMRIEEKLIYEKTIFDRGFLMGKEEGLQEGVNKNNIEIKAENLKKAGYLMAMGRDKIAIKHLTGLSDEELSKEAVKFIEQLKKNNTATYGVVDQLKGFIKKIFVPRFN